MWCGEIGRELEAAIGRATAAGIPRERVIIDPGFGFAKRAEHTWESLAGLDRLAGARSAHPRRPVPKIVPDVGHRRSARPPNATGPPPRR